MLWQETNFNGVLMASEIKKQSIFNTITCDVACDEYV